LKNAPHLNDHGVTSSFFGIGILPVSDLLDFWYFWEEELIEVEGILYLLLLYLKLQLQVTKVTAIYTG